MPLPRRYPRARSRCNNRVRMVGQQQLPVNVLGKAAAVVDVLAEWPESTAAELAELTGQPRSTVYRLLESLQRLGWVERGSARGRFRLGMRLFRIGRTAAGRVGGAPA